MEKYCNNCGNYGHIYKTCRHPILSYGIILYSYDKENKPKIVMVERKDSLSYIEFLRGKYKSPNNYDYIKLLISRMTNKEKMNLMKSNFETLWKDLWIHTDSINNRVQQEYNKSKEHFNTLKKGISLKTKQYSLESLINESDGGYSFNEWEIPKGRRKGHENNKDCAIREFKEETNIDRSKYTMFNNIIPLIEEYKGINNVKYKHIYYIGHIDELCELNIDMENKDQYTEIKDIQWYNEEECYQRLREYHKNKIGVIESFFKFLKTHKNFVTIQ